jgi:hypothetical protein
MTREPLPFDHRPDPALGAALGQALEPEGADHAAFVARLLARLDDARGTPSWDRVLARWARLGVAAAVLFSLAAGYLAGRATAAPARPSVAEALIAPRTPVVEVVLASVLGN